MKKLDYGNTQVELIDRRLDVTRVGCKFSRVRSIERQRFRGRAARAVVGDKLGHAGNTRGLSDDQLIRRAIEAARIGATARLAFPDTTLATSRIDPDLNRMSESDLRALAEEIMRGIGHGQPDIAVELELRRVREEIRLQNSSGGRVELARNWLEGDAWVERHSGTDVLVVADTFASAHVNGEVPHAFARRMARRLRWARRPVDPRTGTQSVILSPGAFASLLGPMLHRLSGTQAGRSSSSSRKHRSGFARRIGQQMFDARFSLYDDATLPDRPYSAPVDHEGTPGQRTALVERGIIKGFYHNLHSAVMAGTQSTGNGWRSLMDPPHPVPTNIVVAPGTTRLRDMLEALGDGLLIDVVMSSDGASGLRGDFSRTVVLGYQIRHGRPVGFVRGVGVGGNLYESLKHIEALGCQGVWSGHVSAPYIQIGGVTVTA